MKMYLVILLCLLLNVHQLMGFHESNNSLTLEAGYHNKGRLKIGNNDVCYDNINKTMADKFCQKLGYLSAIRYWPSLQGFTRGYHINCDDNDTNSCQIDNNRPPCSNQVVNLFCQNIVLVGSNNTNEGRVELIYKGEQGLLCDDSFSKFSADTICRQLGYQKSLTYSVSNTALSKYGFHYSSYILDDLVCPELASDINECRHTNWRSHNCGGQYETVGVECSSELLVPRLEAIGPDGSVQIRVNNTWFHLQHPSLSFYDAHLMCVERGYLTVSEMKSRVAGSNERLIFHQFNCSSYMTNLDQCTQIIPKKIKFMDYYFEEERIEQLNCTRNYEVRKLPNGFTQIKGLGEWSTICYSGINEATATSLCIHMGYRNVRNYGGIYSPYSNNYTYLHCSGLGDLRNCSLRFNYYCSVSLNLTCSNNAGLLQIVPGYHNKGLVKVGTSAVCMDSFTKTTADSICRDLGYIDAIRFWGSRTNLPNVKITCYNSQSPFDHCTFYYNDTCYSGESVNVFCQNLRLAGRNHAEGRVEVIYKNQVGQLCDDSFNINSAHTVCKQLGFKKAISFSSPGSAYYQYGSHNNRFILDDLRCSSIYDDINLCPHTAWLRHNCGSHEVQGVQCLDSDYCKNGTVNINIGNFNSASTQSVYPVPSSIVRIIPDGATDWCTGVFIDELWVLTSASCFLLNTNMYTVYINTYSGTRNLTVYRHPSYNDRTGDNNLALIKIDHNYHIIPMCLHNDSLIQFLDRIRDNGWNNNMFVGWNQYSLYSKQTDLFSVSECARHTGLDASRLENLFCGPVNSTLNFYGQSGGPLFGNYNSNYLIGITNKAIKAARPFNNMIFTNIYKYKDWIDSTINSH